MPVWIQNGCDDYTKRLPRHWQFRVKEFAQAKSATPELAMHKEADVLLAAVTDQSHLVALDNRGAHWSTSDLAKQLENWQSIGKDIAFIVGGPDGLHSRCLERADQSWSLSPLTFPHPLVRVIVTEQLYRAQSMLDNHPYHRA